jgi:hypothetical protein
LDIGATNDMMGSMSSFTDLDEAIGRTMHFDDGSVVGIEGKGTVVVECKNGEQQRLASVYHIPKLTANILSLGQLNEDGYRIVIEHGVLRVWDPRGELLMKVEHRATRLYLIMLNIAGPACHLVRDIELAWRWHRRYGHFGFQGLKKLAQGSMVHELPSIELVD